MTPPVRRARARDERGSASVLVLVAAAVLALVAVALGAVGGMVVAHRQAQGAADLAALAGAAAVADGDDGCAVAASTARANGANVATCRVTGDEVWVEVHVPGPDWRGAGRPLAASARAGPSR